MRLILQLLMSPLGSMLLIAIGAAVVLVALLLGMR